MRPIAEIAEVLGLDQAMVIPYGKYKAKIPLDAIKVRRPARVDGRRHRHNSHSGRRGKDHHNSGAGPGNGQAG